LINIIDSIYRYPIKGLSGERLDSVMLSPNNVIQGDREFAFARPGVNFDQDNPKYIHKTKFLALVRDEKLASLEAKFDNTLKRLSLSRYGKVLIEVCLTSCDDRQRIGDFLSDYLDLSPLKRPRIIRATGGTTNHSFSDLPHKAISLINLSSIMELSERAGVQLDPMRFRGNINFKNDIPWQEFDWINRNFAIGDAVLSVFKRTQRCAATSVNPFSAIRDINVPKELSKHYKHINMGVYATVIKSGVIKTGDKIQLLQ
jgi:uncharacterized protein YcbX